MKTQTIVIGRPYPSHRPQQTRRIALLRSMRIRLRNFILRDHAADETHGTPPFSTELRHSSRNATIPCGIFPFRRKVWHHRARFRHNIHYFNRLRGKTAISQPPSSSFIYRCSIGDMLIMLWEHQRNYLRHPCHWRRLVVVIRGYSCGSRGVAPTSMSISRRVFS